MARSPVAGRRAGQRLTVNLPASAAVTLSSLSFPSAPSYFDLKNPRGGS
jgi:hypothetical protein